MAYNYLEPNDLADAFQDSTVYMKEFYYHIPELQRLTRGKPGKIPRGKPRVTDGTLAAIRRETPKQIIQQLPTGRVTMYDNEDMEDNANAILTDVIIPNANSGGIPYAKAKRAIKSTIDVGSAWAHCFMNRTGSIIHADYKIKYYADVLFEKGKVSEFDTNYMAVVDWLTEGDIKALIWQEQQRQVTTTTWDLKMLQALLDKGPSPKDEWAKTPEEKKANAMNGYFKLVHFLQRGTGATFYTWSPAVKAVLNDRVSNDPRGIIPVHGLVPEDDDDNPLGEPLAAISAGKQNLLDFDMQMYQYGQALQYSPPVKKWGETPASKIKLIPDNVIEMNGAKATDDIEPVNLANAATANFTNNQGLLKTQIQAEMGRRSDTTVSGMAGAPQASKTQAGVQQSQAVTDISNNDLLMSYEQWQGRVWETCLNLHFAESKGTKEVQLERATLQRLKLDKQPIIDYDKDYGKLGFTITAFTSKRLSDAEQVANMAQLDPLMTLQNIWAFGQKGWKLDIGEFQKARFERMSLDSLDKILTKMTPEEHKQAMQEPYPIIDPPQFRIATADMTPEQIAGVLARGGVNVPLAPNLPPGAPLPPTQPGQMPLGLSAKEQANFILESQKTQLAAQTSQDGAAPQTPKTLGEAIAWQAGDLTPDERAQALAQVGIRADQSGNPTPNETSQAVDTAVKLDKHVQDSTLALTDHAIKHTMPETLPTNTHEPIGEPS